MPTRPPPERQRAPGPSCGCVACAAYQRHFDRETRRGRVMLPPELDGARVIYRPAWWPPVKLIAQSYAALAVLDFTWRLIVQALVALGFWPW